MYNYRCPGSIARAPPPPLPSSHSLHHERPFTCCHHIVDSNTSHTFPERYQSGISACTHITHSTLQRFHALLFLLPPSVRGLTLLSAPCSAPPAPSHTLCATLLPNKREANWCQASVKSAWNDGARDACRLCLRSGVIAKLVASFMLQGKCTSLLSVSGAHLEEEHLAPGA